MGTLNAGALTADQITLLHNKLVVPVAISDILTYGLDVEAEMQYGLHEALSEVEPDCALLAIALSAQYIAKATNGTQVIAGALSAEAGNTLADYAPAFIRDVKRGSLPEENFLDVLETVPEDLEALADLLDALIADIEDDLSTISTLAGVLSIQARAHMEIANYILEESGRIEGTSDFYIFDKELGLMMDDLELDITQPEAIKDYNPQNPQGTIAQNAQNSGDNIILFPAHLRS